MLKRKRNQVDRILTGWLIGTVVPLVIFMITYEAKFNELGFLIYLKQLWNMGIFLKILSVCVFSNLGFFFIFYKKKYDLAARGVLLATFMYAFIVLVAKFI